ncbi:hypothetical protein B0F90DRAFT_1818731 [Multifurca ochricompacta]|uniref:Uncharacterized protein n=1 Tax=Multifurca ochricompacta TaxID=376703 RepID=A0AAD4M1W5_9AGAM|nr:hypothetical protein B0F90DRAFT_1818731 [Multifurca ochricompacta]
MPSTIPPSLSPPPLPAAVAKVPSPAVSPAIVGRGAYEQSVAFRGPSAGFEIEHVSSPRGQPRPLMRRGVSDYTNENLLSSSIAPSSRLKHDPSTRQSGITHSLDFPIDVDYDTPPALDVLMAACRPHPQIIDDVDSDSLFYPTNLPLTTSLELANHPILEAVRNTLFPTLPGGHYLHAVRDKVEIFPTGASMGVQPPPGDMRVATLIVTLPVRFRGGALVVNVVNAPKDNEERFQARGWKSGHVEWVAHLSDCAAEVEPVQKGCRITISYAVHLKTFGPSGVSPDPLIAPTDRFLDHLAPIFNMTRGRMIAFYLTGDYGVNPADVLAESLVPYLKGGDSLLYHAVKLYKLSPELRWTAGGYIWPVDRTVECGPEPDGNSYSGSGRRPLSGVYGAAPYVDGGEQIINLQHRVEQSGAIPLAEANIVLLADEDISGSMSGSISKERVPLVSNGLLDKLVVNILLVVFVP